MSNKVKSYRGAVQSWECDSNGHMNVMYYVNKFELGGRNMGEELGLSLTLLKTNNWGVAVVKQEINYVHEAFEDDLIYIESSLIHTSNKTFVILHEMKRVDNDEHIATMEATAVILDKGTRKAVAIPEEIKKGMEVFKA